MRRQWQGVCTVGMTSPMRGLARYLAFTLSMFAALNARIPGVIASGDLCTLPANGDSRGMSPGAVGILVGPGACPLPAAAGASSSPAATSPAVSVVHAFYTFHFSHGMGFTEEGVRARAAWLAPDLLAKCAAYFKKPAAKDEVPDIDGDPFTDSQEYPGSFRVGQARTSGSVAMVPVVLSWPDRERRVQVELHAVRGSWKISDLIYEGGESFRQLLSR